MDHVGKCLKRVGFESFCGNRSDSGCMFVLWLLLLAGPAGLLCDSADAHYPFPISQEEKAKADKIEQARKQSDQQGVDILIGFLEDENLRVRTAAFISLIHLSPSGFEMDRAVQIAKQRTGQENQRISPYLNAAADVFLIVQNPALSRDQKQDKMIELSSSEDGPMRRMAVEGLKAYGDARCLTALAERINDPFGGHDDSYDMRAVSGIAFEAWWKMKAANLNNEQQISTIIASLEAARPFSSRWADAACDILEGLGDAAVPQLIEAYSGKSGNAKSWAARTLRKPELQGRDRSRVREIAIRDLRSNDPNDRRMAAYLLERFYEKEDLDLFVELLTSDENDEIRTFVVSRLADLGGGRAVEALRGVLGNKDEQEHIRILAARSLASLGEKDGHDLLLESLGSLDNYARNISLGSIQYLDPDRVCARMLDLVEDIETFKSDDERQRFLFGYARADIFRYLDKMPAHKLEPAIPTLKRLLQYPDDSISRPAANLLKKLGVALKWKYDIGQKRGWFEIVPDGGAKEATKASATAKRPKVTLSSASRRAAEAELNAARQCCRQYWAMREDSTHDSEQARASFGKAVSAFRAVSMKYAGTDIDAQAHTGLFKLFHLAGNKERSDEIVAAISDQFGRDAVSDAYFELGIDYLQRAHDPGRALAVFEKIPLSPAPDPNDKSPGGLHNYEQVRYTYVKVLQPMAKCEVQLGEFGKAEECYDRLIELFPELKESFQKSLEFEVRSIATRTPRNKYWLSLSGLKQKLLQQKAARWLEDFQKRRQAGLE